jgi:hypothetical protein
VRAACCGPGAWSVVDCAFDAVRRNSESRGIPLDFVCTRISGFSRIRFYRKCIAKHRRADDLIL